MPYHSLYVLIVALLICAFIYFILFTFTMLRIKGVKQDVDMLMKNYNCFNLKVAYDGLLLEKATAIIDNNGLEPEKKSEMLELIAFCQQSISCDFIVHMSQKISKEEAITNV